MLFCVLLFYNFDSNYMGDKMYVPWGGFDSPSVDFT